jgi:hypothetical protein
MGLRTWSRSELEYGRKVLESGMEGARSGRTEFLRATTSPSSISGSFRNALKPAALGACIGVLSSCPGSRRASMGETIARGFLGGVIGFGAGIAWQARRLAASVARGALDSMGKVRDEHWLERHPIDYA